MDNLNDLKAIWLSANTDSLPNAKEIPLMAKSFRNEKLRKKILIIAAASFLVVLEALVAVIYQSTMITTRLGEACIIAAGSMLLITNIRSIGRFYKFNVYTNKEFLSFLEQTRVNQLRYHTKTQLIALSLCSAGLPLYLFETVYGHFFAGLLIFLISAIFLLIIWFVVRPRTFKKQSITINKTIMRLKKISSQL